MTRVPCDLRASCLFVAAFALVVFWPVVTYDFVDYDDDVFVTDSPLARGGFHAAALKETLTRPLLDHWVPLTEMSHGVDLLLFGRRPRGHHLVNLLLHVANAMILLLLLRRLTGDGWRSAFVAALFAVHPLQVESVAWVAERKGVLSSFFALLALWNYAVYVEKPSRGRYAAILASFAAALLSKASAVTLPCLMLLLDGWPLGRAREGWRRLLAEKLPLFLISAVFVWVALSAVDPRSYSELPFASRLGYAAQGCGAYLRKFLWPSGLSVLYPRPGTAFVWWRAGGAGLLLGGLSLVAFRLRRDRPHLLAGWLWFVIGLAPMLGFFQAGKQAMADRYMYLPLIGLAFAAAWELPELDARAARLPAVAAAALLSAMMVAGALQVRYWRDSITLFEHAVRVDETNVLAHLNLGAALVAAGAIDEAAAHFRRAWEIDPNSPWIKARLRRPGPRAPASPGY